MFKLNGKNLITGTTLIAIVVGFSLTINHYTNAHSNNDSKQKQQHNATFASVWDKPSNVDYKGNNKMTVYRSPSCGCCGGWIAHMKKQGFAITDIKTEDMDAIKQKYNLPAELASCHTTVIDGYVLEGHIPADDIKRFLTEKPTDSKGLAVPAMPIGTPGMESGEMKQPFSVLAFNQKGETTVFNRYDNY